MKSSAITQNIVIDLEFAPIPKGRRLNGLRNEIIQIGAVRVDASGNLLDSFSCYVAPVLVGSIPPNIVSLTGIRDADLVGAPHFEEALELLAQWVGSAPGTRMVAWSGADKAQIQDECSAKGLPCPVFGHWLDLQRVFPRVMEVCGRRGSHMSLEDAFEWSGLAMDLKRMHTAIYDAECTANLLAMLITGEYRAHKESLAAAMPQHVARKAASNGFNLGSMCGALAALYQQMTAEAVAC